MKYFIEVPTTNINKNDSTIQKQITDQLASILLTLGLLISTSIATYINANLRKQIKKIKSNRNANPNLIYIRLGELKQILGCDRILIVNMEEKELKIRYEYNDEQLRRIELGELDKYENEINYLKVQGILYLNSNEIESEFFIDKNEEIILVLIDRKWIMCIYYLLQLKDKRIDQNELEVIKTKTSSIVKDLRKILNESGSESIK